MTDVTAGREAPTSWAPQGTEAPANMGTRGQKNTHSLGHLRAEKHPLTWVPVGREALTHSGIATVKRSRSCCNLRTAQPERAPQRSGAGTPRSLRSWLGDTEQAPPCAACVHFSQFAPPPSMSWHPPTSDVAREPPTCLNEVPCHLSTVAITEDTIPLVSLVSASASDPHATT